MDEPDPETSIDDLEARIERLRATIAGCRKAIIVSRGAALVGGLWLVGALFGYFTSIAGFLLAVSGCLGGAVGMGSNTTTQRQAEDELAACVAERNAVIDGIDMRTVESGAQVIPFRSR